MIRFLLNDRLVETPLPPATPALDYVRTHQRLTGTKTGCREGDCGACTVLLGDLSADGQSVRYRSMTSCLLPLANLHGKHLVTVEGLNLSPKPHDLNRAQQAIVDAGGTQCGFCTAGFVVSLAGFCLDAGPSATAQAACASIDGNICRCTGYKSLERAAAALTATLQERPTENALPWLTENGFVPKHFEGAAEKLAALRPAQPPQTLKSSNPPTLLSGGTDLLVQRPDALLSVSTQSLFDTPALQGISRHGNSVRIGAAVTAQELMDSPILAAIFPRLRQHLKLVSSTPIRQMGTVGGNLCNASPIGDLTCWFLALDATLTLDGGAEPQRQVPLRQFYTGYKQLAKSPEEYVESLTFRVPGPTTFFNFEKVSKRTHLDIASVNSSALLTVDAAGFITEAHLSAGGVFATPLYLRRTSAFLVGQPVSRATVDAANEIAQSEIAPIADARGTEAYKRLLLRQLLRGHFIEGGWVV